MSAGARGENRGLNTGTALNVRLRFLPQRGGRRNEERDGRAEKIAAQRSETHIAAARFRQSMGRQFYKTKKRREAENGGRSVDFRNPHIFPQNSHKAKLFSVSGDFR